MSKAKDRQRAKHILYRNGAPVATSEIRRKEQEARDAKENERARKLGLLLPDRRGVHRLVVPGELIKAGLVKGAK